MSEEHFDIGPHTIGVGHAPFIVAEVAQAHEGSLSMAHAYIDAVADAGAAAVKFQTHIASEESTLDEPFRVALRGQDATRFDYWRRMEFTEEQWIALAVHAAERGILFLSTPFSLAALRLLERLDLPAWKIASGDAVTGAFLDRICGMGKPVLLSTGLSTFAEIGASVDQLREAQVPFALFQCTTSYPTSLEDVGLNLLGELRERYGCPVGLSDHSGQLLPGLAALARGANLLEVHVTFDRQMHGPDVTASVTIDELEFLVDAAAAFVEMDRNPVEKDAMAERLAETRAIFSRSWAPVRPLDADTVLQADMLALKKPGTGIVGADLPKLVGRKLRRAAPADRLLRWEDVE